MADTDRFFEKLKQIRIQELTERGFTPEQIELVLSGESEESEFGSDQELSNVAPGTNVAEPQTVQATQGQDAPTGALFELLRKFADTRPKVRRKTPRRAKSAKDRFEETAEILFGAK